MKLTDAKTTARAIDVHEQVLRQLAREGKIPSYRLSERTLRFDLAELRRHMKKIARREQGRKKSEGNAA